MRILPFRPKSFDSSFRELRLSELTSVSFHVLLVSRAYWWYLWMATKMIGVKMGFDKLTIGGGPNNLKVPWSDSKLDSTCTRSIGSSPGGRRPDRGAAAPLEED